MFGKKKEPAPRRTNAPAGDVGPFDSEGWKINQDGSRVHRWDCSVHSGESCDGHCGPR